MPALLDVRGLEVAYGRFLAIDGIDLVVPNGSVVGVLGPNGAGKSTLLRSIAGLVPSRAGTSRVVLEADAVQGGPGGGPCRRLRRAS